MTEEPETPARTITRGRNSPAYGLQEAMLFLKRLVENVGSGPYGRDVIAESLGNKPGSGTANSKIGALTHFGLLTVKRGAGYSLSDLANRVLHPTSLEEEKACLIEAVKIPDLYAELIAAYMGKQLPSMFANLLTRNHGVLPNSAVETAKIFRDSIDYAGLLRNGLIIDSVEKIVENQTPPLSKPENIKPDAKEEEISLKTDERHIDTQPSSTLGFQTYTIPLDGNGRIAILKIPLPVSGNDLETIKNWASFMMHVVKTNT